jgi:protocatechuate 3,4-dioxygenase alpha subunit
MSGPTPSQTVGPFFSIGLPLVGRVTGAGPRITIEGSVKDGAGEPVADAVIETWQADASGRYAHPEDNRGATGFFGFARVATSKDGGFTIETIKPGPVPGPGNRLQAPHLVVGVLARGLLTRIVTRIYFEDEPANEQDPILERVPATRTGTLIARRLAEGRYCFYLVLQGKDETVFFAV